MADNDFVILTGTANLALAKEVGKILNKEVHETVTQFADGEKRIVIPVNLRRKDVYIIQPTCPPVDSNLMELLFILDAAKRASAEDVTAVIPYFGYSRQDRKDRPRVPISASLTAGLIEYSGADRVVTVDLHSEQEQGFIRKPWDNLFGSYALVPLLREEFGNSLVIASPDKGGVAKSTFYSDQLDAKGIAIVFKQRDVLKENVSETLDMIGEVEGEDVLLVDDMIDTAGTICGAADLIMKRGAKSVSAAATHGLFSKPALDRISKSALKMVYTTDTVPLKDEVLNHPKVKVVSIAKLIAKAIEAIHVGDSISEIINSLSPSA